MKLSVIFDLDGTLIDSAPDIHATANRVMQARGHAAFTQAEVRGFVGRGAPNLVARLMDARGAPAEGPQYDAVLAEFLEVYESAVTLTVLYPHALAALRELAAGGTQLGICTNKPLAPTLSVLRHFGIDGLFATVLGGDSLAVRKPDPAHLLAAVERMGGGPAVFVGDSEVDAETAERAGLPFLLFSEGYRKSPVAALPHSAAFADFRDLPRLVAEIRATVSATAAP